MLLNNLKQKITRKKLLDFIRKNKSSLHTLDLGCGNAPYKHLFSDRIGFDNKSGEGVDVVGDAHKLPFKNEEFDTVLCSEVLEHLHSPEIALAEMKRVLKSGGILILTTRFIYPIHDAPNDYWRFTPDAFKSLLKIFEQSFVGFAGRAEFPHTIVGVAKKGAELSVIEFEARYKQWKKKWDYPGSKWKKTIKALTPPVIIDLYRRIKNGDQAKNNG